MIFNGTFAGNLIGFLYFAFFLFGGILLSSRLLASQRAAVRLWLGIVFGIVLLMWLPAALSMLLGFSVLSHLLAALLLAAGCTVCLLCTKKLPRGDHFRFDKETLVMLALSLPLLLFFTLVLSDHILKESPSGGYIFGQSTYFDANIHLSFITTPVTQGTIPFAYNILPSAQVSYPFLSDTISASIYIWGSSLRFAYVLPMVFGALAVFCGAFLFFSTWLKSIKKAALAWTLFFFNGGFGFAYFLDGLRIDSTNFTRIFTALYETPTNLNDRMIRWVNTVCDMMIPQRASLFGWMMLFSCLYLLYRAVFLKEKRLFLYAGILAGLTPMISTHIFLSLGVICAVWMMSRLVAMANIRPRTIGKITAGLLLAILAAFFVTGLKTGTSLKTFGYDSAGFSALLLGGTALLLLWAWLLISALHRGYFKEILCTWGLFLGIVLLLALPQLFGFTFRQSSGSGFMQAHFNWINYRDTYLWFYIKNVGIVALLLIPALLAGSNRLRSVAAPIAVLMLLADTFAFQPNVYDNNKLLYPAYALACGAVAEYMGLLYQKLKDIRGIKFVAAGVITLCMLSAVLSMGREAVSGVYEIYSAPQVQAAAWIQENTEKDAMLLTNDRYNNALSSLTGRNIVCGSNSFLSTHGHGEEYTARQKDVSAIYASPEQNRELLEKYNVTHIVVGPDEYASYNINEEGIAAIADLVYEKDGVKIYKIHEP